MRYLVACVVLVCTYQAHAGTITGTEEGTATIGIQQIVGGTPEGFTWYDPVPATLTYTLNVNDQNHDLDSFRFAITDNVYSIDTSSSQFDGPRGYSFYLPPPPASTEFWFMASGIYHIYGLQTDFGLTEPGDSMAFAGFDLIVADTSGTGYEVEGGFSDPPADPPAGVPEPSSMLIMAIGLLVILLRRYRCFA